MISRVRRARGAALVACAAVTVAWTVTGCSDGGEKPDPSASADALDDTDDTDDEGYSWIDGVPVVPGYGVGEVPPVPTYEFPENLNGLLALSTSDIQLGDLAKTYRGVTVTAADCSMHDVEQASGSDGNIDWTQNSDGSLRYDQGDVTINVGADRKSGTYKDPTREYNNWGDGGGTYTDDVVDAYILVRDDGTIGSSATFADGRRFANLGAGDGLYSSDEDAYAGTYEPGSFAIYNHGNGSGSYEDAYLRVVNSGDGTGAVLLKETEEYYDTTVEPLPPMPAIAPLAPLDPDAAAKFCGISLQVDTALMFDFGSADLRSSSGGMLDSVAQALQDNDVPKVVVEGHTDALGNPDANQALSEQRAQAVVNALKDKGVTATLVPVGYGSTRPVAPETTPTGADDPAGRQVNRRVEIFIPDI